MFSAVTIVAKNYLAQAAILRESFLRHHPDSRFFTLVIDAGGQIRQDLNFPGVVVPSDLDIDSEVLDRMAAIYDVMEFATALKPKVLEFVLKSTGKKVLYIDPDIEIFRALDVVELALDDHPIVLTPHNNLPMPRDGLETSEQSIRYSGIFNLGFIGVNQESFGFLEWWHERLITDAVVDLDQALFTDQRWIDFAPALFDVKVLRNSGLNVAYWNIHERKLDRGVDGEVTANDEPLYFYHFSGFDPTTPWVLTKHDGSRPRFSVSGSTVLRELCDSYGHRLDENDFATSKRATYGLSRSADGFPLSKEIRRSYRQWWLAAITNDDIWPPKVFDPDSGFTAWMTELVLGACHSPHSRAERSLWENSDYLQNLFPDIDATSSDPYRHWLDGSAERKELLVTVIVRDSIRSFVSEGVIGWNLLSFQGTLHESSVTEKICRDLIRGAGLPGEGVRVRQSSAPRSYEGRPTVDRLPLFEDVLTIDFGGESGRLLDQAGFTRRPRRKRIVLNLWSFDVAHVNAEASWKEFDEIWCPSDFVFDAIPESLREKAMRIYLPLEDPGSLSGLSKSILKLPESFVFLTVFDGGKFAGQDDPVAVVKAYLKTFAVDDGSNLVVRVINGAEASRTLEQMKYFAFGRPDIQIIDSVSTDGEIVGLIHASDCYVSLHRTTAFGFNIARAVLAGKPVVATGYSGNMSYMGNLGLDVAYKISPVAAEMSMVPKKAHWALADTDDAGKKMRLVFEGFHSYSENAKTWSNEIGKLHQLRYGIKNVRKSIL